MSRLSSRNLSAQSQWRSATSAKQSGQPVTCLILDSCQWALGTGAVASDIFRGFKKPPWSLIQKVTISPLASSYTTHKLKLTHLLWTHSLHTNFISWFAYTYIYRFSVGILHDSKRYRRVSFLAIWLELCATMKSTKWENVANACNSGVR